MFNIAHFRQVLGDRVILGPPFFLIVSKSEHLRDPLLAQYVEVYPFAGRSPLTASTALAKNNRDFDPKKFLATIGEGRKVCGFPKKQTIFRAGRCG
jgi:hypothetical protein